MYKIYLEDIESSHYFIGSSGNSILIYDDTQIDETNALIDPTLTLEENAAGKLSFTIPPTHSSFSIFHDSLQSFGYTKWVYVKKTVDDVSREVVVWKGRVISSEEDFWKCIKVECEGLLSVLNDTIQPQVIYSNRTVRGFLQNLLNYHNAHVDDYARTINLGYVLDSSDALGNPLFTDYETTLSCIIEKIIKVVGGRVQLRYDSNTSQWYLDYYKYYDESDQTITFGSNLFDYSRSMEATDVCTEVIPLGKKQKKENKNQLLETYITVASVNYGDIHVHLDGTEIDPDPIEPPIIIPIDPTIPASASINATQPTTPVTPGPYDIYGPYTKVQHFDDIESPSELLTAAKAWLNDRQFANLKLEVSVMDLSYENPRVSTLWLGDAVRVISSPHGMDRVFPITKMEIKLDTPEDALLTLGSDSQVSLSSATSSRNTAISNRLALIPSEESLTNIYRQEAAEMIERATTGYINIIQNPTTGAEEFVVSNVPNYLEATRIWRWTMGGLGFSNQGYDSGTYTLALTADGRINADLISTGTLVADIIKAGVLTDQSGNGNFWFNLTTGEYSIRAIDDIISGESQFVTLTQLEQTAASIALSAAATYSTIEDTPVVNLMPQLYHTGRAGDFTNGPITSTAYNVSYYAPGDGSYTIGGGPAYNVGSTTNSSVRYDLTYFNAEFGNIPPVQLDPSKEYTLSGAPNNMPTWQNQTSSNPRLDKGVQWGVALSNTIPIDRAAAGTVQIYGKTADPIHIPSGYKYCWVWIGVGLDHTVLPAGGLTFWPMLEVGRVAHPFVQPGTGSGVLSRRIAANTAAIEVNANNISAKVSLTTYNSDKTTINNRLSTAESSITLNATNIQSKVSLTDYTGQTIASKINQSATSVVIQAAHISLAGKTIDMTTDNIVISSTNFSVTKEGNITAKSGTIGGFTIDSNTIYAGGAKTTNSNGQVAWSTANFTRTVASTQRTDWRFAIGSNFGVTTSGILYSSNAVVSGTVTATTLVSNNATITGGTIKISTSAAEQDIIELNYGTSYRSRLSPGGLTISQTNYLVGFSAQGINLADSGGNRGYWQQSSFRLADSSYNASVTWNGSYLTVAKNAYGDLAKTGSDLTASNNVGTTSTVVKNISSKELTAGVWLLCGHANFPSNSVGYRKAYFCESSTGTTAVNDCCQCVPAVNGATTILSFCTEVKPTANKTYYLNVYQNSGSTLSVTGRIFAIRIA